MLWNKKNIRPPRRLVQLSILTSGLRVLDKETQLKSLKIKLIQKLLKPNNVLRKNLMLHQMNLILNYNQDMALFRQKQILRYNIHKHLQNQGNEDFFIELLNVWRHILPITTSLPLRL